MLAVVPKIRRQGNYVQQGFPSIVLNLMRNLDYFSLLCHIELFVLSAGFERKYRNFFSSGPKGKNGTL